MNNNKGLMMSAVSGMIAAGALSFGLHAHAEDAKKNSATTPAASAAEGECHGVNSCKGKGECGGKGHSCAGKNSCKGKGWVKATKEECAQKHGKFKAETGA
jgi:hypothetical protein